MGGLTVHDLGLAVQTVGVVLSVCSVIWITIRGLPHVCAGLVHSLIFAFTALVQALQPPIFYGVNEVGAAIVAAFLFWLAQVVVATLFGLVGAGVRWVLRRFLRS